MRGVGAVVFGAIVALAVLVGPAGAAERAVRPAESAPTCSLPVTSAPPGGVVPTRIEHVVAGTQVTLRFDGAAVGDAVAAGDGTAVVRWTVPADARTGDHTLVFVGESVYCELSSLLRVNRPDAPTSSVLAEGTVGAAVRRASAPDSKFVFTGSRISAASLVVMSMAVVATAIGVSLAWRRRRLRIPA